MLQLEAQKMRDKYIIQKKMINITNVTLASDDDYQREAQKVRRQIYYTTTKNFQRRQSPIRSYIDYIDYV